MSKILNIVKSRFIKGEDLPDWYERRLKICSNCNLNSLNVKKEDKKLTRKSWELIAGAHCMHKSCGCTITQKTKIEEESCPEGFWNSTEEKLDYLNIYAEDNSKEFKWNKDTKKYTLDYGDIPFKSDSSVVVFITDKELSNLSIVSSCGCTTANPKYSIKGVEIEIKYDTKRVGGFSKNITITYSKNNTSKKTIINIKGTVKNSN